MKKRILSMLLLVAMLVTGIPVMAVTASEGEAVTKTYVASVEAKAGTVLTDPTLQPVAVAVMKYGDAVSAYLAM